MAGHASHAARGGIVHHAPQHVIVLVILRGSDLSHPGGRRQEAGVGHFERRKDMGRAVLIERCS